MTTDRPALTFRWSPDVVRHTAPTRSATTLCGLEVALTTDTWRPAMTMLETRCARCQTEAALL